MRINYNKIIQCVRRWSDNNRDSIFIKIAEKFRWDNAIKLLAILGLYILPLFTLEKNVFPETSVIVKILRWYFDVLMAIGKDWCLIIHALFCVIVIIVFDILSVINNSGNKNND